MSTDIDLPAHLRDSCVEAEAGLAGLGSAGRGLGVVGIILCGRPQRQGLGGWGGQARGATTVALPLNRPGAGQDQRCGIDRQPNLAGRLLQH